MSAPALPEPDPGDEQADCGAGDREQQALGQDQPREPPARRTERQTHGELPVARRRPCEKQIREVGAGDEQHEDDRTEQYERRRPYVLEQCRGPRRRRQLPVLVLRELRLLGLFHAASGRRQLRVGLRERRTGRKAREDVELPDVTWNSQRIAAPGNPEVRADQDQTGGHHADDRRRASTDADRAVQDCGIAAEPALPEPMADDRRGRTVRAELLPREATAERRRHADHRKQVVEQKSREYALRDVPAGNVAVAEVERAHVREAAVRPDVDVLGRRQRLDVGRLGRELGERHADRHEALRIRIGERVEDEPVEHAVDQAVATDREPEREHGNGREPRPAGELAERVPQVLNERVHLGPLSGLWQAGRASRDPRAPGRRRAGGRGVGARWRRYPRQCR